jgi:hypothetical protein
VSIIIQAFVADVRDLAEFIAAKAIEHYDLALKDEEVKCVLP